MLKVHVDIEENVYTYRPPGNGSGPMWCRGSSCIVRLGNELLASGLETLPEVRPLNNCVPLLFRRTSTGWRETWRHDRRTREPSPLACFHDGRVLLSLNPTLAPEAPEGPAEPLLAEFSAAVAGAPRILVPAWSGKPGFTEHSYRSLAADGARGELILFQNVDMSHVEFTFLDAGGSWAAHGRLDWPWGAECDRPQPVRVCYPSVQLKDRAVWFCGVSDIEEPYEQWRAFKRALAGREWDYDLRRLFFTWSDDIATGRFHQWTEVASRDRTCGWITPRDLHVDAAGNVHVLWSERAIDERLREKFFPLERQSHCLHYAIIRDGIVMFRRAIHAAGPTGEKPGDARFQPTPDGRLLVLYALLDANGRPRTLLREILSDGALGAEVTVPLAQPTERFFTAGVRAGCEPSDVVDVLGDAGGVIRYARIRLA